MQFQHVIVTEIAEANVTVIGLLAGVRARMNFQLFRACETFAASFDGTFVGFLA